MANPEGYRNAALDENGREVWYSCSDAYRYPVLIQGWKRKNVMKEAIARNIFEMVRLKVPIITIIVGEGASGGALGIGVGDRVYMLENTWYSVISPESCSSILWKSWEYKEIAAEALKLTSSDMKRQKLVDDIIPEPLGGAHYDRETTFITVEQYIIA
jgi:acetyl-CoA carboxylase carboxyl transferase subunit alpha